MCTYTYTHYASASVHVFACISGLNNDCLTTCKSKNVVMMNSTVYPS